MAIKANWTGKEPEAIDLEFLNGIPARSLEDAEYDALDAEQKQAVDASPLYTVRAAADAPVEVEPEAAPEAASEPKEGGS